jgi:hypothetical protein
MVTNWTIGKGKWARTCSYVLSTGEVRTLLASIRQPVRRMALTTIYALGLRLGEGLRLETGRRLQDAPSERRRLAVAARRTGARNGSCARTRAPRARCPACKSCELRLYKRLTAEQCAAFVLQVPDGRRRSRCSLTVVDVKTLLRYAAFVDLRGFCGEAFLSSSRTTRRTTVSRDSCS